MTHKCNLCKKELATTFLDKIIGTIIKTGEGETSKTIYICPSCQKEHGKDLRKKVSK